jgi:anti-sigma-K factor RskA
MSDNDLHSLAGEYVLGTLDAAERMDVERRRAGETDLESSIQAWQSWLMPLAEVQPVQPSPQLWQLLSARLFADDPLRHMQKRVQRWRRFALAASLAAVIAIGVDMFAPHAVAPRMDVAMLPTKTGAAFMVSMNEQDHSMTVSMQGGDMPKDRSYQLWMIMNDKVPHPMGVMASATTVMRPDISHFALDDVRGATLAISLEPMGGSPTGMPTGEIISTGKFVTG